MDTPVLLLLLPSMDTLVLLLLLPSMDTPAMLDLDMDMPDTTASVRQRLTLMLTLSARWLLDSQLLMPMPLAMATMLE